MRWPSQSATEYNVIACCRHIDSDGVRGHYHRHRFVLLDLFWLCAVDTHDGVCLLNIGVATTSFQPDSAGCLVRVIVFATDLQLILKKGAICE